MKTSSKLLGYSVVLVAAGMMYGSWAPFELQSARLSDVMAVYRDVPEWWVASRSDTAANVALSVPFALLLTSFFLSFGTGFAWRLSSVGAVMLATGLLSLVLELGQGWFANRVPSLADTIAQLIGAIFGGSVGWLIGPSVAKSLDQMVAAPQRARRIQAASTLAALLALLWSVLPGQILVSPADYARKWSRGQIELVPFTLLNPWSPEAIYQAGWNMLLGVPLGFWACHSLEITRQTRLRIPSQLLVLLGLGMLPEVLQVFVAGRFTSATDVIFVTCGVTLGFYAARIGWGASQGREEVVRLRDPAVWFGFAVLALSVVCFLSWFPFNFTTDAGELKRRWEAVLAHPFADYRGSNFLMFFETIRTVVFGTIIGGFSGVAIGLIGHRQIRRAVFIVLFLSAAVVALGIELGQWLEGSRRGSGTGALACTAGIWLGLFGGRSLVSLQDPGSAAEEVDEA